MNFSHKSAYFLTILNCFKCLSAVLFCDIYCVGQNGIMIFVFCVFFITKTIHFAGYLLPFKIYKLNFTGRM